MSRIKFLKEEIAEKRNAIDAINAACDKETRARTDEEATKWAGFDKEIDSMETELRDLEKLEAGKAKRATEVAKEERTATEAATLAGAGVSKEDKELDNVKKRYSVGKAFGHQRNHSAYDGVEAEVQAEAEAELRALGKTAQGTAIPSSMLETRTDIDQNTSGIQPTEVGAYVRALRENAIYEKMGVDVMNGLTADHKIPIVGKQNTSWVAAENTTAPDGGTNFTSKTLSPKWIRSFVNVSNTLLIQNGSAAMSSVMADLGRSTAQTIDLAMWSTASVTNAPTSIAATSGVGTFVEAAAFANGVSMFGDLVKAEQELADAEGIEGNLRYLLATNFLSQLKISAQVASVTPGSPNLQYENQIQNGYPTQYTIAATKIGGTSGDGLFGDFSKIKLGFFGGMDMTLDRWGDALLADQTRIVLHRHLDFVLPQGAAFVKFTSLDS